MMGDRAVLMGIWAPHIVSYRFFLLFISFDICWAYSFWPAEIFGLRGDEHWLVLRNTVKDGCTLDDSILITVECGRQSFKGQLR